MPVRALPALAAMALAVACAGCFCIPWPRCTPMTCTEARSNCGEVPDGCGGVLDCGTCRAPETCGGFGTPNVCGCTPVSCASVGANCGSLPDGCGRVLDCGSCTPRWTCGGGAGGRPNVCGCNLTSSLCPGCFGKRNGYAYLTASFDQSSPAGSATGQLSFVDDQANVVGWGFRMAVDGAITPGSTALTGQLEICNAKYSAFGTGRFHATLCVGGLPIQH